jgi:SPP1 family predicted phage head-tail adaptor
MPAVGSGQLRHRVELQSQQQTQDATTGEVTVAWVTYATVWAEIVPMSAREFIQSDANQSEVRGRIVIRYRDDVSATHRAVYRSKYYNIHGILPDAESGKEHLTLMTGEGVNLGE